MDDVVYEIMGTLGVMFVLALVQVFRHSAGARLLTIARNISAHARKYALPNGCP